MFLDYIWKCVCLKRIPLIDHSNFWLFKVYVNRQFFTTWGLTKILNPMDWYSMFSCPLPSYQANWQGAYFTWTTRTYFLFPQPPYSWRQDKQFPTPGLNDWTCCSRGCPGRERGGREGGGHGNRTKEPCIMQKDLREYIIMTYNFATSSYGQNY